MVRKIAMLVGLLAGVVVLVLWLSGAFHGKVPSGRAQGQPQPAEVPLEPVTAVKVLATESAVGTVRPVYEAAVASKLLERVAAVNVGAGAVVAEGTVLVQLDRQVLNARLNQAQAAVNAAQAVRNDAKANLDRIQQAFEKNVATKMELDTARNRLLVAEAELQRAQQVLDEAKAQAEFTTIRSPLTGVVIDKKVNPGDTVAPGQVLVTLYDPTRMQLVAPVREGLARRLVVGMPVEVCIDALEKTCRATVSEIVPEAEAATRTFSVKVTGPCPPGVYAGMFGRLIIPLDEQEVLVIPTSAVRRVGQLEMVEVWEDGALRRRAVQLGRTMKIESRGEVVTVLSGLREGERVAVRAERTPRDG